MLGGVKEKFADGLLKIAIVLSLMRIEHDSYFGLSPQRYRGPHHQLLHDDIILDSHTTSHSFHGRAHWHGDFMHPKSVDSSRIDEIFRELHSLGEFRRFTGVQTDLSTWPVNVVEPLFFRQREPLREQQAVETNRLELNDVNLRGNVDDDDVGNPSFLSHFDSDLSKEDMDLIDILWRQDIDLGVSREMFESDLWQEQEKEFNKDPTDKEGQEKEMREKENNQYPQLDLSGNYVVDNETGELVPVTPTISTAGITSLLLNPSSAIPTDQPPQHITPPVDDRAPEDNDDEFGEFNDDREFQDSSPDYVTGEDLIRQHSNVSDFAVIPFSIMNGVDQSWEDVFSILDEQEMLAVGSQQPPATVDDHSSISSFIQLPVVVYIDDPSIAFNQELLLPMTLQPSASFQQDPFNHSLDHFDHNLTFNNQVTLFPSFNETTPMNQHEMSTLPIGRQFAPDMTSYHYQPMSAALVQNVSMADAVPMMTDELTILNNWSMMQNLTPLAVSTLDNQTYTSLLLSPSFNLSEDLFGINMDIVNTSFGGEHATVSPSNQYFPPADRCQFVDTVSPVDDLDEAITVAVSYANNDSFIQELLQNDFINLDFDDNFDEDQSGLDLDAINDDWSTDSAVYSMESPNQLLSSYRDDLVSEIDGVEEMEGATGGKEETKYSTELYDHFNTEDYNSASPNSLLKTNSSCSSNDTHPSVEGTSPKQVFHNHTYYLQPGQRSREEKEAEIKKEKDDKATRSRDTKRAKSLKLPFSIDDIIYLPVDEFTEMLTRYTLTEAQHQLVRDIRRRGKNKAAAQNCRKRKLEIIQSLEDEVEGLRRQRDHLSHAKHGLDTQTSQLREKFARLQADLLRSLRDASGRPYDPNEYSLQRTTDGDIILVPRNATVGVSNGFASAGRKDDSKKDGTDRLQKHKRKD